MLPIDMSAVTDAFWSDRIWFGESKLSWEDFKEVDIKSYELLYPIPIALFLLVSRGIFVDFVFENLGSLLGLKRSVKTKLFADAKLDTAFKNRNNSDKNDVIKKAIESGMTERQAERWLRKRIQDDTPSKSEKLVETTWRAIYYLGTCIFGMKILYNKKWLWNTRYCWYDYPHHPVEDEIRWYYIIQLTYYWFLTFSQIYGDSTKKRKDFWQMLLHHVAAISLICFSGVLNMVRCGMLTLVLHDTADALLEIAKMCKYAGWQKTCDTMFVLFTITWMITRLYIYPKYVLYTAVVESAEILGIPPVYYIMNFFMILLQILHVIWTVYLLKAVGKVFKSNGHVKDERSSSE
jgi:ceramide synthetase